MTGTLRSATRAEHLERLLEIPMIVVSLAAVPVLLIEHAAVTTQAAAVAWVMNLLIWLAFVVEYTVMMFVVRDRLRYMRTHLLDLAIILLTPPILVPPSMAGLRLLHSLRALRLVRLARVAGTTSLPGFLQVLTFAARALDGARRVLTRNSFHYVAPAALGLVAAAGILLYRLEGGGSLGSVFDGIWWAVTTMTTVGYGDIAPRTVLGRALGIAVMFMGIGLTAVLTANIVAEFIEKERPKPDNFVVEEIRELRRELAAVRAWLERLEAGLASQRTDQEESRGGSCHYTGPPAPRGSPDPVT